MTNLTVNSVPVDFDPRIAERGGSFPLTEGQREIWVSAVLDSDANKAFNLVSHLTIRGLVDRDAMRAASEKLMRRHSVLRSRFSENGDTFQIVGEDKPDWSFWDLTDDQDSDDRIVESIGLEVTDREFDLTTGPLLRIGLVQEAPQIFHLFFVVHHIICDGWSARILLKDLSDYYNAALNSTEPELQAPPRFSQYALRNAMLAGTAEKEEAIDHWRNALADLEEPARLQPDQTRQPQRTYNADSIFHWLDDDLAHDITQFAKTKNVSLFTVLLSIFAVWMSKLSNSDDIVVGVPVAGQPFFGMPDLVGHCANLLPFRCMIDHASSFDSILGQVQACVADGYEHQIATFGEILQSLVLKRQASAIPLIPVTLNVVSASETVSFTGCESERVAVSKRFGTFELALDIYREGDRLELEAIFNRDLFTRTTMSAWLDSLAIIARYSIDHASRPVSEFPLIDAQRFEEFEALSICRRDEYPLEKPLPVMFDEISETRPAKTAVASEDGSISYDELKSLSNKFAAELRSLGAGPGKIVAVYIERTSILPAVLLGILKTGAAYLPIDPVFPSKRRAYMLEDSGAKIVVTQSSFSSDIGPECTTLLVDVELQRIKDSDQLDFPSLARPNDRAYVIYTSGSTGNPKGVEISHRNLTNFLLAMSERPGLSADDRVLAITSLSFDISVLELYLPLICGAGAYIATSREASDGSLLAGLIDDYSLTVMQGTPASWRLLIASGWEGKSALKALCGGEPLPSELVPELLSRGCELWNMYGPTETTVWSTCCRVANVDDAISIGTPVANNEVYLLDEGMQVLPPGVSGEICIGGDAVAIGYLNRPQLTKERFIKITLPNGVAKRVYRTGDLGVRNTEGLLFHQGRMDSQVKLRGYRIELGEIETRLTEHSAIAQAVVDIWNDDQGDPVLIAYLKAETESDALGLSAMRSYLNDTLPAYMIPQRIEWMDAFPLTPNGKVDRKKLRPSKQAATSAAEAPKGLSHTESRVGRIWAEAIGGKQPSRNDNFFEIGGHSLLAVRVLGTIKEQFGLTVPTHMIALEDLQSISRYIDENSLLAKTASFGGIMHLLRSVFADKPAA